jgi:SAM-dependent methyltransferase
MSDYDDEIWRLVPEGGERSAPPRLSRFVSELGPVKRALDLGCGDGRLTAQINAEEVVGADVSPVALARARRLVPDGELVEVERDAALPLVDSRFDLVLCAETIEHVRDVQLLLSEARRVLRPGGTLAVTTPAHGRLTALAVLVGGFERSFDPLSPHIRFFTRRSLREVLSQTGFDVASLRREAGSLLATARR